MRVRAAVDALNDVDVAIVQHEYGIYGGLDGDDVVGVLRALSVPSIVVAHTVVRHPTPHQRFVLEAVSEAADAVVVMTDYARRRLIDGFDVDAEKISVIPHGATTLPDDAPLPERQPGARLRLLTWGLLGPGKGIEWAIDAMALLADVHPRPSYLIAGTTHPKVLANEGEAYREMLGTRSWRNGACRSVEFDDSYRGLPALTRMIRAADLVILPYDSADQVTSGVLVDAVACGRPVVATAFPARDRAAERRRRGRRAPTRRNGDRRCGAKRRRPSRTARPNGRRVPATGTGHVVAVGGPPLHRAGGLPGSCGTGQRVSGSVATFAYIVAMSDGIGTFEHADHSTPRLDEGYCTDDMARVLVAACREPGADETAADLARKAYLFLIGAQRSDGMIRNRRAAHGGWSGPYGVEDCWGRAMWAFGTARRSAPQEWLRDSAEVSFDRGVELRSPSPRAMAFAALGAAEVLAVRPQHAGARQLLSDTVDVIGRPDPDPDWVWPERRLAYANAVLAEATIVAGALLGRPDVLDDGLAALRWLLTRETVAGHLSPTGTDGAGPGDRPPMFDQQPIEAATMADACARAFQITGDPDWNDGLRLAVGWFLGVNDTETPLRDAERGACFDGLTANGVNENRGAESTLALITTLQHDRTIASAG